MSWWKRFTPATKKDVKGINMKLSELNTALTTVNDTLTRVQAEVQALKDSLSDVDIPAEAQASLDKLVSLAKAIDELNPDTEPPANT